MEQKITIQSDGDPIDHDKALAEAIQVSDKTKLLFIFIYINIKISWFINYLIILLTEHGKIVQFLFIQA